MRFETHMGVICRPVKKKNKEFDVNTVIILGTLSEFPRCLDGNSGACLMKIYFYIWSLT